MKDNDLLRYSSHIMLPEVDIKGQQTLKDSHVLLIGLGGLGSIVATFLIRSGFGKITICDYDKVELSNLSRQILFKESDIGIEKVIVAKEQLQLISSSCVIKEIDQPFNRSLINKLTDDYDLVVDATDNFLSRYEINSFCQNNSIDLVSGSSLGWNGQVTSFNFSLNKTPCYQCLYGYEEEEDLNCAESGVLSPVVGLIGSLQSIEAIKLILQLEIKVYNPSLLDINTLTGHIRRIKVISDPNCKVCSANQ